MLDFSWKIFSMTGNLDTYLLMKELERESDDQFGQEDTEESEAFDAPTH
ncbi:YqzL family protein [Halalkalibacter oceani]|uniref:YqzL family protein n=1 Tax=Halalkalibacter oceani TaxID=1653776 RepID=A0A9X2DLC1_9BACI|nr:YqzL family protein [Halalkalibacter oceani]MCM3712839.1 YqzL family protein [Halalkalibacter oceani]MCM3761496.1 YqzL family protein [Halalkalibacter oceani]